MKISGPCHIVVHVLEFFGLRNTRSGLQEVALRHRALRLEVGATGYVHSNSITRVMGFCMFCPFGVPLYGS